MFGELTKDSIHLRESDAAITGHSYLQTRPRVGPAETSSGAVAKGRQENL